MNKTSFNRIADISCPSLGQAFVIVFILMLFRVFLGTCINIIEKYTVADINVAVVDGFAYAIFFGLIILYSLHFEWKKFAEIYCFKGFRSINLIPIVFSAVGLSFVVSELDNGIRNLIPMAKYHTAIHASQVISDTGILGSLFTMMIVIPVFYELLFRGLFLKSFLVKYPRGSAIAYSIFLCALLEGNPWQFTDIILLGTLVSIWYIRFESIVPCIIGHSIYNLMPILFFSILKIDMPGYSSNLEARGYQPLWFDLTGVVLMFLAGLMFYAFYRQEKKES